MSGGEEGGPVWTLCYTCGADLQNKTDETSWRRCRTCKIKLRLLDLVILGIAFFSAVFRYWCCGGMVGILSSTYLGALLNLGGVRFVADGFFGPMILGAYGWGGNTASFRRFAPRQFWKEFTGVLLFALGFLLQQVPLTGWP